MLLKLLVNYSQSASRLGKRWTLKLRLVPVTFNIHFKILKSQCYRMLYVVYLSYDGMNAWRISSSPRGNVDSVCFKVPVKHEHSTFDSWGRWSFLSVYHPVEFLPNLKYARCWLKCYLSFSEVCRLISYLLVDGCSGDVGVIVLSTWL